jgi:hypothetical protein
MAGCAVIAIRQPGLIAIWPMAGRPLNKINVVQPIHVVVAQSLSRLTDANKIGKFIYNVCLI